LDLRIVMFFISGRGILLECCPSTIMDPQECECIFGGPKPYHQIVCYSTIVNTQEWGFSSRKECKWNVMKEQEEEEDVGND